MVCRIETASSDFGFDDAVGWTFSLPGQRQQSGRIRAGFPAPAVNRQKRPKIGMAFRHREPTRRLSPSLRIGLPASAINPKSVPMKNRSI